MEAGGRLQTVYGFGCSLDWWPTLFDKAFPTDTVCSACSLVCSMSAVQPCGHVLCRRCYHKCAGGERCRCPLDGRAHRKEDLVWRTFTTDTLLCSKIRCWNTGHGCTAEGPASAVLAHFHDNCEYHVVNCERCDRTVALKDVIDHLGLENCGQEQPGASPNLEGIEAASLLQSLQSLDHKLTESARLSFDAIKKIHESNTSLESIISAVRQSSRREISDILGHLESRLGNTCSESTAKVLTACSSIGSVVTALKAASLNDKDTKKALKELQESINKRAGTEELLHIIKRLEEKLIVVMAASNAILENKLNSSETLDWTIGGWSRLKEAKNRGEIAISWAEKPGCFYGYSILPGAEIIDIEGIRSLRLVFQICQGSYDQLLAWPLEKDIRFKVVHPTESGIVECRVLTTKHSDAEGLRMPTVRRRILFAQNGIKIANLEANGFNLNDQIRVKFEVLHSSD